MSPQYRSFSIILSYCSLLMQGVLGFSSFFLFFVSFRYFIYIPLLYYYIPLSSNSL
ncbi:hypothetical protein COCSADRAFT_40892 [Bipolaris sorokiniana ND90Pr]|uniref:Uncharacterized protein n=1 Tax=Cochliobolus sativus (strain ND90Pr / ATCC 201652) TaxID=665912 RepID=M2SSD1_COCSN|nr:uncharacterized protein COCSADRAFT_40892 [Bipolaris sorokiniana ND90Pr]EMD59732.1 hypothetical protein COCSADRAFT_40892 [Bipolaris sorokiniana ND90Pr]